MCFGNLNVKIVSVSDGVLSVEVTGNHNILADKLRDSGVVEGSGEMEGVGTTILS